jgi:hypothetical protein
MHRGPPWQFKHCSYVAYTVLGPTDEIAKPNYLSL